MTSNDYKELIIKLLDKIEDISVLSKIYTVVKTFLD